MCPQGAAEGSCGACKVLGVSKRFWGVHEVLLQLLLGSRSVFRGFGGRSLRGSGGVPEVPPKVLQVLLDTSSCAGWVSFPPSSPNFPFLPLQP